MCSYNYLKTLLFPIFFVYLTGCAPVATPQLTTYTLHPNIAVKSISATSAKTLLITQPIAAPEINTNKIAYFTHALQIHYFTRTQWVAPPAQLLLPILVNTLQIQGSFRAVVAAPFGGMTTLRLDSRLDHFEQRFYPDGHSDFFMSLAVTLFNSQSGQIIATKVLQSVVPVTVLTIAAAIDSADQACAEVLKQLIIFTRGKRI